MLKDLKRTLSALVRDGQTDVDELYKKCLELTASWPDKPDPTEFDRIIKECLDSHKLGIALVQRWVEESEGEFGLNLAYDQLEAHGAFHKALIRENLHRLVEKGVIVHSGKKRGVYRRVENNRPEIDLSQVAPKDMDLYLPFGLHKWVRLFRKSIIVVAGEGNKGKTAAAIDFIKHNMNNRDIHLFFSEGGAEEVRNRLDDHEDIGIDEWSFKVHERATNFEDVIFPDAINVVDYMNIGGDDFYRVGDMIDKIFRKLNDGIAYINIQKSKGKELGHGGELSMERARLYVTMNTDFTRYNQPEDIQYGVAKIIKAKGWKKKQNPDGRVLPYSIKHGWQIRWEGDWAYQESHDTAKKGRMF